MKRYILKAGAICAALCICHGAAAQAWEPELDISADARFDYQYGWIDGHTVDGQSGFKGKFLDIQLDGQLNKHLKYSWRQRLNKSAYDSSFFDATDWVYLTYAPDKDWDFTAGKVVVNIGGYEYDSSPIDIHRYSEYCNNIPCYELGINIGRNFNDGKDRLIAQVTTNPFHRLEWVKNGNTYAYSLMWNGHHGIYSSLWSVNLIEYTKGHYINYISLGNRLEWKGWRLDVDLMNRASRHQAFLFKDFSLMADLRYSFPKFTIYGKATYDVNHSGRQGDYCVWDGTELWQFLAGAEYFPFRNDRHEVRVHADVSYVKGTNTNPDPVLLDKNLLVNVGVTWKFDICHLAKKKKE